MSSDNLQHAHVALNAACACCKLIDDQCGKYRVLTNFASIVMPPPLGAGGIMFSGCPSVSPSVRPKPEIISFHLYMGPLVRPTNHDQFAACPSVRPEMFPGICRRRHGGNGLKFCMLMYLWHLQNWLDYGHGLLIFLLLASLWLI